MKRSIIFSGSDAKAANTGRKKDGWREWPGLSTKKFPTTLARDILSATLKTGKANSRESILNLLWEAERVLDGAGAGIKIPARKTPVSIIP